MSVMCARNTDRRPARDALLSVILFGVLLASVGGAWLVVRRSGGPTASSRGAEIVARIRRETLGAFWPGSTSIRWFLLRQGRDVVGFRSVVTQPRADGGFDRLRMDVRPWTDRPGSIWSHCRLNADATECQYRAGRLDITPRGMGISSDTRIVLADGRVEMAQRIGSSIIGRYIRSSAPSPANYLPEGTLWLACRLVARRRDEARCSLIIDHLAPIGSATRFVEVLISYVGRGDANTDVVRVSPEPVEASAGQMYHLDADGRVVGHVAGETVASLASAESIAEDFPDARRLVERMMKRVGMAAEEADAEPEVPPDPTGWL